MPLRIQGAEAGQAGGPARNRLDVGLVNLMPDAALEATERQFAARLAAASEAVEVRLHLYSLPGVPRGPAALAHLAARYGDLDALEASRLDALIVTGAEPVAAALDEEPYWPALTRVVDWAEGNTTSTIWSCLAAHAAVLHLDGVRRVRLPEKRSGLYECVAATRDPLLDGAPSGMRVPHSRWNDLPEGALRQHGYRILSRSHEAGIDSFTKRWSSHFVFLQGHPEYELDTLAREFRRDVRRYLTREGAALPAVPRHYFDLATERRLARFLDHAASHRREETWAEWPDTWSIRPALAEAWAATASRFYRNWLDQLALARA